MTQLAVSGVSASIGAETIFRDITFTAAAGDRWGIIGRNGTGKSTLFRMITGSFEPSAGSIVRQPGIRISLLEQHTDFREADTVWCAAAAGLDGVVELGHRLERLAQSLGSSGDDNGTLHEYATLLEKFEHAGGYGADARVDAVLDGLGFDPVTSRARPLSALSGGERGRLALVRELVRGADILLLDEPTNHLDLDTTRWLERELAGSGQTLLLVSHDRAFLASLVDHILHFEGGTAVPYTAGYEDFVLQRAERRLSQERQVDKQRKVVAAEEDYIRRNIAGQNTRQAKGRRKRLERLPRLSAPPSETGTMALRLSTNARGGDQVLVAERARIEGGGRLLVDNFTTELRRGDRVAFVGANGSGKSTLLRTAAGEHSLAAGVLRLGGSITTAFYRQDLTQLPLDGTPYDAVVALRPMWERGAVQGHLGRFGFSGDEVRRRISSFSGGERARLALALVMLRGANLLMFDEPTNHLDVESVEAMEDALDEYDGTVILVSHDRELLRAVSTRVWALRNGRVDVYDGGFAEWEAAGLAEMPIEGLRPVAGTAQRKAPPAAVMGSAVTTARTNRRDSERTMRRSASAVASAEEEIAALEARVTSLTERLADPGFYDAPDASDLAFREARALSEARSALDSALARWSEAMENLSRAEAALGVVTGKSNEVDA